ncbi:MAG: metallophosphoesterase [Prolixibacteraceae bacterium]|nr:metallophosphoesterase [Prolixibacteraceae bacterium]
MRTLSFFIFFSIVLVVYSSLNYFVYSRGLMVFSCTPAYKKWYTLIFWTLVSSFLVGMFWERAASSVVSEWIYRVGAFWLAFMFYFLVALLLIDLVRLSNYFFHYLPDFSPAGKLYLGYTVIGLVSLVVLGGYINALTTRIREIPLTIHKTVTGNPELKILMASDIHLGALIGERQEMKLVRIINEQKPDLVLLCGDLVDGDIGPALRKNLGRHIQEIRTPLGVYAIPGNHEYIGGIRNTLPYLQSINIKVLRDEVVTLPNGIQLVGRDDRDSRRMGETTQPHELKELTKGLDHTKPIVVMNHQPHHLDEAVEVGADLHLSGHTHHGQMWPFNYITEAIFELSWGLKQKGNTIFYVSSGFGSWGPPVRIGNSPEVVVFNIHFD